MNLLHLKYAVEIEKTRSISKAAENLYMGQPNLSRAIKELETSLNFTIFSRTTKGIKVTAEGKEFLRYARSILAQVEEIESISERKQRRLSRFSISAPRASYITQAFCALVERHKYDMNLEFYYKETNARRAIDNILYANYNLGIIRYQSEYEGQFRELAAEKGLRMKELNTFTEQVVMSQRHPLAACAALRSEDLSKYTELCHGDPYVPTVPSAEMRKSSDLSGSKIYLFERGSQFDLLTDVNTTYMWASRIPEKLLGRYQLVQRECVDFGRQFKDVMVYKKGYRFSAIDIEFIEGLREK